MEGMMKKNPPGTLQFWLRIAIYYLFLLIPMIHPSMAVAADFRILWGLLGLIPLQAGLGFYRPPFPGKKGRGWIWPLLLFLLSLPLMGWTGSTIPYLLVGLWAYMVTYLAFHRQMAWLLYPEPFFMAASMLRLLSFSRESSSSVVMALLFLGFTAYLFLLFRINQQGKKGGGLWKEAILVLILFTALGLVIAPLAPKRFEPDLIRRDRLQERRPRNAGKGQGLEDAEGNEQGEEGNQGEDEGNSLQMVSQSEWSKGRRGEQKGDGSQNGPPKQYMVFVAQSPFSTAYLAEEYFSVLDPVEGFTPDSDLYLNQLNLQRYLETWKNDQAVNDIFRQSLQIKIYSTNDKNYIPYYPYMLEPTVRDDRYYPLAFSYRTLSFPSKLVPGGSRPFVPEMTQAQKEEMAVNLEIPLNPGDAERYRQYLDQILDGDMSTTDRIQAILESFNDFQYQVGFSDDISIPAINTFLFESKEGDCSEFSNSAALLGRMAGIPSRVVTGFLLSRDLQTPAHVEGLMELRKVHQPLAQEPLDQLYLITTAHHHSWTQFYLPRYGWVDYETTSYAIPPPPGGDMNELDVVVPRIYALDDQTFMLNLPWGLMLRTALALMGVLVLFQYLRRRIALARLKILAARQNEKGLKALYALLINRYNGREKHRKNPSLTPRELAQQWSEFEAFGSLYESTLLNPNLSREEIALRMEQLRQEYRKLMVEHRSLGKWFRELLSLREVR